MARELSERKMYLNLSNGGGIIRQIPCVVDPLVPNNQTTLCIIRDSQRLSEIFGIPGSKLSLVDAEDVETVFSPEQAIYVTNATCGDENWHKTMNSEAKPWQETPLW